MKGKIKYAQFLHDASEIQIKNRHGYGAMKNSGMGENDVNIALPVNKPDVEIPVIELILN